MSKRLKLQPIKFNETALINQILKLLKFKYNITAWRNHSVGIYDAARKVFRKPHTRRGTSDILGLLPTNGKLLAIEAKVHPNKPTIDQLLFIQDVKNSHGIGFVAYSLEDVEKHLHDNI